MADTRTAPPAGRAKLRLVAHNSPQHTPAASQYARAFMLRLARQLAQSAGIKRRRQRAQSAPSTSPEGEGQA